MSDKTYFELCRLCLSRGGLLVNIFDENNKLEIMLGKTIEDLIGVKVVEDTRYPWLVCSTCMEKLTEFRLFKRRCAECLFVFYNRVQSGCYPAAKDWIPNQEFPSGIKNEFDDNDGITSEARQDKRAVNVQHDMVIVKEEVDHANECPAALEIDTSSSMVGSMQQGDSHWSDNEYSGNLFPCGIKREFGDDGIPSDTIDRTAVDVQDDMIIVKEEVDAVSGCSGDLEINTGSSVATSMQKSESHWSDNEDSGNSGRSVDGEFCPSFNVDVEIKEECDVDIPQKEGGLGGDVSAGRNGDQGREGSREEGTGNFLHWCEICNEGFAEEDILNAHVMRVHPVKTEQIRCDVCSEVFECKSDFDGHAALVHGAKKKHQCQHCPKGFRCERDLKRHMFTHGGEKQHKCEVCSRAFSLKQHLKRHMLVHSGERPHKCEVCLKSFNCKKHVQDHMLTHTGERRHKCAVCAKAFTLKQHLKDHMVTHSGEKPHKCEVCPRAFTLKQQLKEHALMHSGARRPHECTECSKAFTHKQHLERHVLIHTGERPYICGICSKSFTRKEHLEGHVLVHSGEKPHKCGICPRAFALKQHLKEHMFNHKGEKPHKCQQCPKSFTCKGDLGRHTMTHGRINSHQCDVCLRIFAKKCSLTQHKKVHRDKNQRMPTEDSSASIAHSPESVPNDAQAACH